MIDKDFKAYNQKSNGHYMHKDLDHTYDGEYMRYEDRDEEIMKHHAHFKEVENPHEDVEYSPTSHEDQHRHHFPSEDRYYPGELPGSYETRYYSNDLPFNALEKDNSQTQYDNVLEDEDPAICFVKAYARKPLGVPKKTVANSMDLDNYWYGDYEGFPSNRLDWNRYDYNNYDDYGDYDDEDDYYGDEFDNYGMYDDGFSDSEGDYYDEDNQGGYSDEDDSEEEDEETSSEEDDSGRDGFDLSFDDDMWENESRYPQHAQYFDLAANQEAPQSKPSPSATDSEESDEDEDEESSENEANLYGDRPRRRQRRRR